MQAFALPASTGATMGGVPWPSVGVKTMAPLGQKRISRPIPKGYPRLWLPSYFRNNYTFKLLCRLRPVVLKVGSWRSHVSPIWELVRNAHSQNLPETSSVGSPGVGRSLQL